MHVKEQKPMVIKAIEDTLDNVENLIDPLAEGYIALIKKFDELAYKSCKIQPYLANNELILFATCACSHYLTL